MQWCAFYAVLPFCFIFMDFSSDFERFLCVFWAGIHVDFNLASLLADGIVTVFLPVVSSYKELLTVEVGHNDAFSKEIFRDEILAQLYDCYME